MKLQLCKVIIKYLEIYLYIFIYVKELLHKFLTLKKNRAKYLLVVISEITSTFLDVLLLLLHNYSYMLVQFTSIYIYIFLDILLHYRKKCIS